MFHDDETQRVRFVMGGGTSRPAAVSPPHCDLICCPDYYEFGDEFERYFQ